MEELHIDGLAGKAYTLEAYAKALKKRVQLVIWRMPGGKCKLFFSTKLSMKGEEVLKTYRFFVSVSAMQPFFFIIMLVTFAATLLKPQKYVSSRTIQKCGEHVSTST